MTIVRPNAPMAVHFGIGGVDERDMASVGVFGEL